MSTKAPADAGSWADRERYWRRKLGRLKLGVEPLEEQLARYWRVTWGLTIVPMLIALIFLAIFTAFGAPRLGAILVGILLAPIVVVAWIDYGLLRRRAARFEDERRAFERREETGPR